MIDLGFDVRYAPGYEGRYIVYKDGRVYSIPRRGTKGGFLKHGTHSFGYPQVNLTNKDGSQTKWSIHRLVMLTFVGPCPEGMEVCHNNGDPKDCCLENLRYDTSSANNLDAADYGVDKSTIGRVVSGKSWTLQ